jgi:hypothetical protein
MPQDNLQDGFILLKKIGTPFSGKGSLKDGQKSDDQ